MENQNNIEELLKVIKFQQNSLENLLETVIILKEKVIVLEAEVNSLKVAHYGK